MHPKVFVKGFSGWLVFLLVFNDSRSFMLEDAGGTESCARDVGFFRNRNMRKELDGSCYTHRRDEARIHLKRFKNNLRSLNEPAKEITRKEPKETTRMTAAIPSGDNQPIRSNSRKDFSRAESRRSRNDRERSVNYRHFRIESKSNARRNLLTVRENTILNYLPVGSSSRYRDTNLDNGRDRRMENRNTRVYNSNTEIKERTKRVTRNDRLSFDTRKEQKPILAIRSLDNLMSNEESLWLEDKTRVISQQNQPTSRENTRRERRIYASRRQHDTRSREDSQIRNERKEEGSMALRDVSSQRRNLLNVRSSESPRKSSRNEAGIRRTNGRGLDLLPSVTRDTILSGRRNVNSPNEAKQRSSFSQRSKRQLGNHENTEGFKRTRRSSLYEFDMNSMYGRLEGGRRNINRIREFGNDRRQRQNIEIKRADTLNQNRGVDGRNSRRVSSPVEQRYVARIRKFGNERRQENDSNENGSRVLERSALRISYSIDKRQPVLISTRRDAKESRRSTFGMAQIRTTKERIGDLDSSSLYEFDMNSMYGRLEGGRRNINRIQEFGNDRRQRQNIEIRRADTFNQNRGVNGRNSRRVSSPIEQRYVARIRKFGNERRQENDSNENGSRVLERSAFRISYSIDKRQPVLISTRRDAKESRSTFGMAKIRTTKERIGDLDRSVKNLENSPRESRTTPGTETYIIRNEVENAQTGKFKKTWVRNIVWREDLKKTNNLNRRNHLDITRKLSSEPEFRSKNHYEEITRTVENSNGYWRGVQVALAGILVVQWLFVKDEKPKTGCFLRNSMGKFHIF